MRFSNTKLFSRASQFLRETHFVVTGVPSLGSLNRAGGIASGLNEFRHNSAAVKGTLVTTCDVARSLCKPVDDLAGRRGYGSYGYSSPYRGGWGGMSSPAASATRPAAPVGVNLDDKGALLQSLKAQNLPTPDEILSQYAANLADGPGGA